MGRLDGKVAFVTGAARGIGSSQAVRFAEEGADVILVDIARRIGNLPYDLASEDDLDATARQIRQLGRRVRTYTADVRDVEALRAAADGGVADLGRLDVVAASAGIISYGTAVELPEELWRQALDVNLTGVWNTVRATVPHLRTGGRGGSVVLTSSVAGLRAYPDHPHYVASKHGLMGLARALALELGPESIRVNVVNPGGVATEMIHNPQTFALFAPDVPEAERDETTLAPSFQEGNALPVPWVEPIDVANATLFLVSDEARYITGIALPVDAGALLK